MTDINSVHDTLRNTRVLTDTLRDHKVVYLYYNDMKVGRMEFVMNNTPLQGSQYILRSYKIEPDYSELFKGEESPLITIMTYVKTLIV
jgi:hypothetical protein